jgi:predicted metal-dependent TIM-barrel fold hydrolase
MMKEEIFEPAFADEGLLNQLRQDPALRAAFGIVPPGYSRLKAPRFDMDRVWKLMDGAIDVHIHPGPDAYNARVYDELEIAIQACQVGMKAVVYKAHSMQSARSAYFVQKAVDQWAEQHNKRRIDVRGGVMLNDAVGGLNPEAVLTSYRVGGRHVWLPNKDSSFHHKLYGIPGGIELLDENDEVVPALREILALVAEGDMVLSLSHQSVKERFIIIDEAKKLGVKRIEVCHPIAITAKMTVEQMKTAADKGAYLGMYCANLETGHMWSWDEFMKAVNIVVSDRIVIGTDCGSFAYPAPIEAMRLFITGMLMRGIPDKEVEKMVKTNPTQLLY